MPSSSSTSRSRAVSAARAASSSPAAGCRLRKPVGEAVEQPPGDARGDDGVARRDGADAGEQVARRHVLEQEAARAGAQAGEGVLVEVERGQDQHARRGRRPRRSGGWPRCRPCPGMRTSISTTSGSSSAARRTASRAVARLADDREVVLRLEHHAEAGAQQRLVVDEEHAGASRPAPAARRRAACARASRPWSSGPASTVPAYTAARSRMPLSPSPCPPCAAGRAPVPSSLTSTSTPAASKRSVTAARAFGPACLSEFVSASCTRRKTVSWAPGGERRARRPRPRASPGDRPRAPDRRAGRARRGPAGAGASSRFRRRAARPAGRASR